MYIDTARVYTYKIQKAWQDNELSSVTGGKFRQRRGIERGATRRVFVGLPMGKKGLRRLRFKRADIAMRRHDFFAKEWERDGDFAGGDARRIDLRVVANKATGVDLLQDVAREGDIARMHESRRRHEIEYGRLDGTDEEEAFLMWRAFARQYSHALGDVSAIETESLLAKVIDKSLLTQTFDRRLDGVVVLRRLDDSNFENITF